MEFNPDVFIREKVSWLKKEIGAERVFAATSGGVDSTVSAVLTHRAVGKQTIVGFLDDGLMREGEGSSERSWWFE
jgi:GMP synthase (glutamine-hydrolysing)